MTQEKEPPKQGKEKARKAEQVHILLLETGGQDLRVLILCRAAVGKLL